MLLPAGVLLLSTQISGNPVIAPYLNKMFGIRNGIDQVRVWGGAEHVAVPVV